MKIMDEQSVFKKGKKSNKNMGGTMGSTTITGSNNPFENYIELANRFGD